MKKTYVLLITTLLFTSGCASMGTYNPATGKKELIYISTPQEVAMGKDVHESVTREFTFSDDPKYLEAVERVGESLAQVSDRQDYVHKFFVVKKDELNAFTIPGGNIYVFTGLLDRLKSDDQLAAVLAHEIGHGAARHSVKKFQIALGYDLVGRILLSQIDGVSAQRVASLGSNAVMSIVFSSYSRKDEFEADRLGIKYMYLAGYNPDAAIELFAILKEGEKGARVPGILRSHPYINDRIKAAKAAIRSVRNRYSESLLSLQK